MFCIEQTANSIILYSMTIERQNQIDQLIDQTFKSITKLYDTLKSEDFKWANQNCDENDIALSISGFSENLKDWSKMFRS